MTRNPGVRCEGCERAAMEAQGIPGGQHSGEPAGMGVEDPRAQPAGAAEAGTTSPGVGSARECPDCAALERVILALTEGAEAFAVPEPQASYWSGFSRQLNARLNERLPEGRSLAPFREPRKRPGNTSAPREKPRNASAPQERFGSASGPREGFGIPPVPRERFGIPVRAASWWPRAVLAAAACFIGVLALLARAPRIEMTGENETARGVPSETELLEKLRGTSPADLGALASSVAEASPAEASGGGEPPEGLELEPETSRGGLAGSAEARMLQSSFPDEMLGSDIEMSPYERYDRLGSDERRHLLEVIRGEMG